MSRTTYDAIENKTTVWLKSKRGKYKGHWRPLFWFHGFTGKRS